MKIEKKLVQNIRQLRKEKGWTQAKLAEKSGLHLTHINNIETGKYLPSLESIIKIAQALEVPVDYLLKGSEDNIEDIKIANKPFAERIKLLNALNEKEQEVITEVIDAMLTRKKILDFITSKEAIIGK